MYYEIHGSGGPLILLHGAYMTIDLMGPILPGLAKTRRVIAVEQQGHGHTADVDRPLTYEQMADDTAALLRQLEIGSADVVGYSMGGGIALKLAIHHPASVRKLVLASTSFSSDGMHSVALEMFPSITPEQFVGSPIEEAYLRTAPNPGDFPKLVEKLKQLDVTAFAWPSQDIRAIVAPALIVLGDSDGICLEHAVELFGLRGGGVMGDLAGLPQSQLAVLPGTAHFHPPGFGLLDRAEWLLAMIPPFLDAPMPRTRDRRPSNTDLPGCQSLDLIGLPAYRRRERGVGSRALQNAFVPSGAPLFRVRGSLLKPSRDAVALSVILERERSHEFRTRVWHPEARGRG